MSRKIWLGVGLALLVAIGLGLANYKSIILFLVGNLGKQEIAENQEINWARGPETAPEGERPPNVIVILADDLGMNDISTFGGGIASGLVKTPNIDALAARGANLSQAYAGQATCAPSRAMIMTGRYATRHGFEFTPTPNGMIRILEMFYNDGSRPHPMLRDAEAARNTPPMAEQGLPGSEVTMAEVLKARGYHTVHIGKRHLGDTDEFSANAQGFDESLLMASGLYLPEDHPDVVNAKSTSSPLTASSGRGCKRRPSSTAGRCSRRGAI